MTKRETRVVINTNIWLSYLLGGKAYGYLQEILLDKHITILISDKLKEEIIRVVHSRKFSKFFSTQQLNDLIFRSRSFLCALRDVIFFAFFAVKFILLPNYHST